MEVIVAVDENFGIGKANKLPWKIPEELKIFRSKTIDNVVVFGRKTFENVPKLDNRTCYCLTRTNKKLTLKYIHGLYENTPTTVFIAGGSQVYKLAFDSGLVKKVHLSIINKTYDCDSFFDEKWLQNFAIVEKRTYEEFTHYVLEYSEFGERQYLDILDNTLKNGVKRVGRNGLTISTFCNHISFDLREGFPLLTTKKMFLRGVVEELLFFLRGQTDSKILENKKVNIWKGNTSRKFLDSINKPDRKEGLLGPLYGFQFRSAGATYCEETGESIGKGIDQLAEVIELIKTDPTSRRILMTTYNVQQVKDGVLYPCHSLVLQFYVEGDYIDMFCFNRSSDLFLGLPFNIASSSLLLEIIAKTTGKIARRFHLSLGDSHIYENHVDVVNVQLKRTPFKFPTLKISKDINTVEEIENLCFEDFICTNYQSHTKLNAKMIA